MPMTKNRHRVLPRIRGTQEIEAQRKKCGERIRELRNKNGMTLKAFASAIGYNSHSAVLEWEMEKRLPSPEALTAIRDRFDVSTDWVLGLSDVRSTVASVVTVRGEQISDEQLEAALRMKTKEAIRRRMRASDRTAKFMRQAERWNQIDVLMTPGPMVDFVLQRLVEFAENCARRDWRDFVPNRIGRLLSKKLDPEQAAAGELAARLALAELSFESQPAFDDTQRETARARAWALYGRAFDDAS
jgi:transcriptional regulator with XRE-family HTH domain